MASPWWRQKPAKQQTFKCIFYNTIVILVKNETTKLKTCFFHKMLLYWLTKLLMASCNFSLFESIFLEDFMQLNMFAWIQTMFAYLIINCLCFPIIGNSCYVCMYVQYSSHSSLQKNVCNPPWLKKFCSLVRLEQHEEYTAHKSLPLSCKY